MLATCSRALLRGDLWFPLAVPFLDLGVSGLLLRVPALFTMNRCRFPPRGKPPLGLAPYRLRSPQVNGAIAAMNAQQIATPVELSANVTARQAAFDRHRHIQSDMAVSGAQLDVCRETLGKRE